MFLTGVMNRASAIGQSMLRPVREAQFLLTGMQLRQLEHWMENGQGEVSEAMMAEHTAVLIQHVGIARKLGVVSDYEHDYDAIMAGRSRAAAFNPPGPECGPAK